MRSRRPRPRWPGAAGRGPGEQAACGARRGGAGHISEGRLARVEVQGRDRLAAEAGQHAGEHQRGHCLAGADRAAEHHDEPRALDREQGACAVTSFHVRPSGPVTARHDPDVLPPVAAPAVLAGAAQRPLHQGRPDTGPAPDHDDRRRPGVGRRRRWAGGRRCGLARRVLVLPVLISPVFTGKTCAVTVFVRNTRRPSRACEVVRPRGRPAARSPAARSSAARSAPASRSWGARTSAAARPSGVAGRSVPACSPAPPRASGSGGKPGWTSGASSWSASGADACAAGGTITASAVSSGAASGTSTSGPAAEGSARAVPATAGSADSSPASPGSAAASSATSAPAGGGSATAAVSS